MNASVRTVLFCCLLAASATCVRAEATVPSQLRLPLAVAKGGRIFVSIKLDGKSVHMLVDAGAPQSFVHGDTSKEGNTAGTVRGLAGKEVQAVAKNVEMDFGQTISATVNARVLDLSAFIESTTRNDGWPPIAGAIGAELLSAFQATIDYRESLLILNVPRS